MPLETQGHRKNNLIAFARNQGKYWAVVAAPRFYTELSDAGNLPLGEGVWGDTRISTPGRVRVWENTITAETLAESNQRKHLPAAELFARFPGALLIGTEE